MTGRTLVAGIGNIFRSDDGFGSEVVRELAGEPRPPDVDLVDYGIRGMHLAYDLLDRYDTLVVIDAIPAAAAADSVPGTIRVFEVTGDDLRGSGVDAHGMDPLTVLSSLQALGGRLPRTVVVGCVAQSVDEGIGLSPAVSAAVASGADTVAALLTGELARAATVTTTSSGDR